MCPITIPDRDAEWRRGIDACVEIFGEGYFGAIDVQEWIDANPSPAEIAYRARFGR